MSRFYLILLTAWMVRLLFPCQAQAGVASSGGFLENRGQLRTLEGAPAEQVQCYAEAGPFGVYFQRDRISYVLQHAERPEYDRTRLERLMRSDPAQADSLVEAAEAHARLRIHRVDLVLEGARPGIRAELSAANDRPRLNFYIGRDVAETNMRYHRQLRYREVWPGIDMVFFWKGDHLKYDFVLGPDAEVRDIRLRLEGADHLQCTGDSLRIETSLGHLEESLPAIYLRGQDGARTRSLQGRFRLEAGNRLHYQLEGRTRSDRAPNEQLVIDPKLVWSTYLGGSRNDYAADIAVGPQGKTYVVGRTESGFPTTTGAYSTSFNGRNYDGYVTAFNANGALNWSTYLGSAGREANKAVAIDADNNVFVGGMTSGSNFPTRNAYDASINGNEDVYLTKLDSSGSLDFSTYVGGGVTLPYGLENVELFCAADSNVYILSIGDNAVDWPTTSGAYQTTAPQKRSYGIAKFSNSGSLSWSTLLYPTNSATLTNPYFGGDIEVSPCSDHIGITVPYDGNLPTSNGFQSQNPASGSQTAAFFEFSNNGDSVLYSTYIGGSNGSLTGGIAYTDKDEVWVTGTTASSDLPTTDNAINSSLSKVGKFSFIVDGFIIKLDSTKDTSFISYLNVQSIGEIEYDTLTGDIIGLGAPGEIIATKNARDTTQGVSDGLVLRITSDYRLKLAEFFGGNGNDVFNNFDIGGKRLGFAGRTRSVNLPTKNAYQSGAPSGQGFFDGFVLTLENCDTLKPQLNIPDSINLCQGDTLRVKTKQKFFRYDWRRDNSFLSEQDSTLITKGGDYWLLVSDSNFCAGISKKVSVFERPTPQPQITASGPTTFCQGDSVRLRVDSGLARYQWTTNAPGDTSNEVTVRSSGLYLAQVTNRFSCTGLSSPVSVTVNNPVQPLVSASQNNFCAGDSAVLSVATPGNFQSFTWSNGDSTATTSVDSSGRYFLRTVDNNGCAARSSTLNITRFAKPGAQLTVNGPDTFCQGRTTRLRARGGIFQVWNTNVSSNTLTVDSTGDYFFTAYIPGSPCSTNSDTVSILVKPFNRPTIQASRSTALCPLDSVSLSVPSGFDTYRWNTGDTTRSIRVNAVGSYFVRVADTSVSCSGNSDTVQVTRQSPLQKLSIQASDTLLCPGDTAVLSVAGGFAGYRWSNGDSTRQIAVTITDTLSVLGIDQKGCSNPSDTIKIRRSTIGQPRLRTSGPAFICEGDTLRIESRQPYARYRWNTGDTTRALKVDTSGIFRLTVFNADTCSARSAQLQVTVSDTVDASLRPVTAFAVCPGDSAGIIAPNGNFTYQWRGSSITNDTLFTDSAGRYQVTLTDQSTGCIGRLGPVQVTINNAPSPRIALRGDSLLCPGDSTVLEVPGGYPNYQWNTGDTARQITVDTSGRYTATVSNGQGCQGTTRPLQVLVVTPPVATLQSFDADNTICAGDSIAFQAGGGRQNQFLLDSIRVPGFRTRYATDTLRAGQQLRAIAIDSNGCRDTSSALQPTVNPRPQVQFTANDSDLAVCPGDSIRFQASGGRFYNFRLNGGTVQFTLADTFGGVFQQGDEIDVEVTNADGCVDSSQKQRVGIWRPGPAQLAINDSDNFICPEERITLSASGGVRYQFFVNGQLRQDSSEDTFRTRLAPGSNQLQLALTDSNGCRDTSSAISVGVYSPPRADLSADTPSVCLGDTIGLRFRGGRRFQLLVNEQVIQNQTDSLYRTARLRPSDVLGLIATDSNGCQDTSAPLRGIIDSLPRPGLASSVGTAFCAGTSVDFQASGGNVYRFRRNGQTVQNDTLMRWAAGSRLRDADTIALTVIDRNNCRADTSLTVTVFEKPQVSLTSSLGNQRPCPGDTVVLRASGANRLLFQRNGNTVQQGFTDSLVVVDLQTGDVFAVIGEDANGCRDTSASVRIRLRPASRLSVQPAGPITSCPGDTVRLQGPASLSGYRWSTGDTTRSIQVSRAGNYRLRSPRSAAQCPATSPIITVRTQPAPSAAITIPAGRSRFCAGDSLQLRAAERQAGYRWSTGDTTRTTVVRRGGRISLKVTDAQACTNQGDTLVTVDSLPQPAISFGSVRPCTGDSLTLTADTGFADYRWNTGDSIRQSVITRSRPVVVAVTDANGCLGVSDTVQPAFRAVPQPAIQAAGTLNFCQGDSVVLALDSSYANYRWSTSQTDSAITLTSTDTVVLSVIRNGCTGTDTAFTVANNSTTVPLEILGDTSLCPGDTLRIRTARTYSRYRWNTGDTIRTITVTAPGQIDVLAGLPSCQGRSRSVSVDTVPVGPRPQIAAGSSLDFCASDTVRLFLTNPQRNFTGLRWNTGVPGDSLAVTAGGRYFLSAAGAQGCRIPSDTLHLRRQSLPRPAIQAADTAFCPGASLALEIAGRGLSRIRWNTNQQGSRITVAQAGSYFAQVQDSLGCEGVSDTLHIGRYPAVEPMLRYQQGPEVCAGDTARLFTTQVYASYQWSNGDSTASARYDQNGVRPSVRVTDANGCQGEAIASVPVSILPVEMPEIQALSDTAFCPGDSAWLRAVSPTAGAPFRWSNGLQGDTVGIYQPGLIRVRQTNANGCVGVSQPVRLIGREVPVAGFEIDRDQPLCEGDTVRLTARAEGPDLRYRWSNGARGRRLEITATDTVALSTTNGVGCQSRSAAFVFRFAPAPERPAVTASDSVLCGPDDSLFFTGAPGFAGYRWNTGDTSRRLRVTQGGTYQLTVFDAGGCDNSGRARPVALRPVPQPELVLSRDTPIFCAGDTLRASTGDVFDRYRWSTGDSSTAVSLSRSVSALSVEVEQKGCPGFSDSVEVVFVEAPQVAIASPSGFDFCEGDPLLLTATGDAGFYRWSTSDLGARIVVREAGPYQLTGFREGQLNGAILQCAATDSVVVTQKPRPALFSIDRRGDSLLAPRRDGYVYRWFRDGERLLASEEAFVLPRLPGAFQVEVINQGGCSRRADDSVVYTPPVFAAFPNPVRDQLFIEGQVEQAQPVHIALLNTSGQLVFEAERSLESGFYQLVFNLSGLASGVYQMRVKTADEVYQRKLFLQ